MSERLGAGQGGTSGSEHDSTGRLPPPRTEAPVNVPALLTDIDAGTNRLLADPGVTGLDDVAMAAPSLLPDWDRAMVLTHLARNADGLVGMLEGARRGEVVQQYPHGSEGRQRDIEAGRGKPSAKVLADLGSATERLAAICGVMTLMDWERPGQPRSSPSPVPVSRMLVSRRREVEVHHADLDVGYGPDDWPLPFVVDELDLAAGSLPARLPAGLSLRLVDTSSGQSWAAGAGTPTELSAPAGQLLAWLLGRRSTVEGAPAIGPWQ